MRYRLQIAQDETIWKMLFSIHFQGYPLPHPEEERSWYLETSKMVRRLAPVGWDPACSASSFEFSKGNKTVTRKSTQGGPKYPKTLSFLPIDPTKKQKLAFRLKGHAILGLYLTTSKENLHKELNVKGNSEDPCKVAKIRTMDTCLIVTRTQVVYAVRKQSYYAHTHAWSSRFENASTFVGLFNDKKEEGVICELDFFKQNQVRFLLDGRFATSYAFSNPEVYQKPQPGRGSRCAPKLETYLVYCNSAPGSSLESIIPPPKK